MAEPIRDDPITPEYIMAKGKIKSTDVGASLKGQSSPSGNVAGYPGKSMPQHPIPGPAKPGMPISQKKALRK